METITEDEFAQLADAIKVWTGYGHASIPQRNDEKFFTQFTAANKNRILELLKHLDEVFYSSDAAFTSDSLREMAANAKRDFAEHYPLAPPLIADVLAWCYTWDNK